jgi:hypothetical protein
MSNTINGIAGFALPNTLDNENIVDSFNTTYLAIDGTNSMINNLDVGNNKLINVSNATLSTDAINLSQLTGSLTGYVDLTTNQTIAGIKTFASTSTYNILGMQRNNIKNDNKFLFSILGAPQWGVGIYSDAITPRSDFVISKDDLTPILTINHTTPSLSMNNYKIINLANPSNAQDAMTLNYANTNYVDLTSAQTIQGVKIFHNLTSGFGFVPLARSTTSNSRTVRHLNGLGGTDWSEGNEGDGTENFSIYRLGSQPIITLNFVGTPTISMNNYKIINLANPTLTQDAMTLNYANANYQLISNMSLYATLAGTQTFTGAKKFTEASSFGRVQLQRGISSSYSVVQCLNESGSNIWDFGMDLSSLNNQFYIYGYGGATKYMTMTTGGNTNFRGNVTIGTTILPVYPFEITAAPVSTNFTSGYRFGAIGQVPNAPLTTDNINMRSTAGIWAIVFYATSDRRIKEKIYEINDDEALKVIRKLKPVGYSYKDKINRKSGIEYGFIAQDVKEVMPNAVREEKDYIPDIYDLGDYVITSNNQTLITLRTKLITDFKVGTKLKILDLKEQEILCEILTINNYNSFIIDKNFDEIVSPYELTEDDRKNNIKLNTIFIYGSWVEDLNVLDKNSIYSVAIGALQEIDRRQRKHNKQIEKLETQYNELMQLLKNKNII